MGPSVSSPQQPLDGDPAARVLVVGASGFAGALAAELLWRHPSLELAGATARSDVGKPLSELYPRYEVPLALEELDLGALDGVDAAVVAYPHGASAPVVAEMRGLGIKVVDLSADFRLRDLPTYERWYGAHGEPSCSRARSTGFPRSTASGSPRPSWSPTPAAIRPQPCWRWRRWPRRA